MNCGAKRRRAAALVTSAAPILLIGGWTLAARLHHKAFDGRTETISALARRGAPRRQVMTSALIGTGICLIGSGVTLDNVSPSGRVLLVLGGAATTASALSPLDEEHDEGFQGESDVLHHALAGTALGLLGIWPAFGARADMSGSRLQSWVLSPWAAALPLGLVLAYAIEWSRGGRNAGLLERSAAAVEVLLPLGSFCAQSWRPSRTRNEGG